MTVIKTAPSNFKLMNLLQQWLQLINYVFILKNSLITNLTNMKKKTRARV